MSITIRPETPADHEAIRQVNRLAFGQNAEAQLVDALRDDGHVRASLVAEKEGKVVGHILFSELPIVTQARTMASLALAPLAVFPEYQNQGIGSELVRRGLDLCRELGHHSVIVVGHPDFYGRFGFSAERASHLNSPFSGNEFFMAVELVPGALQEVSGRVAYPPPFELGFKEVSSAVVHGHKPLTDESGRSAECNHPPRQLHFIELPDTFAICKLGSDAALPPWASTGDFLSITRTADELSIICCQDRVPGGIRCERGWRCLRVAGTMPLSAVGVLASLTAPLAEAGISVFAVSTFDTDYLLVKEMDLEKARDALRRQGHGFS
jgi:putative acetyltransferase